MGRRYRTSILPQLSNCGDYSSLKGWSNPVYWAHQTPIVSSRSQFTPGPFIDCLNSFEINGFCKLKPGSCPLSHSFPPFEFLPLQLVIFPTKFPFKSHRLGWWENLYLMVKTMFFFFHHLPSPPGPGPSRAAEWPPAPLRSRPRGRGARGPCRLRCRGRDDPRCPWWPWESSRWSRFSSYFHGFYGSSWILLGFGFSWTLRWKSRPFSSSI